MNGTKILWAVGHKPAGAKKTKCWYKRPDTITPEPTPDLRRCVEILTLFAWANAHKESE